MIPNPRDRSNQISKSTIIGIRHAWSDLRRQEATASPRHAEGFARRRMALLSAFPAWQIPQILDELNRPEPEGVTA